jgi:DNA-binding response OmpR family regulator
MATHPRVAFSRRQLIHAVWGGEWYGDEHVVDVHVAHLRRKLGDHADAPRYIRTVRGVGYGMASR